MKLFSRLLSIALTLVFAVCVASVHSSRFNFSTDVKAQATPTPTPAVDQFISQITATTANSFVRGVSGDGRFVVFESEGDVATMRTPDVRDATNANLVTTIGRNNSDGNREIFLYDAAQRAVFQITDTRVARKSETAAYTDVANIEIQVINTQPTISRNGRFIVFSSNAGLETGTGANRSGNSNAPPTLRSPAQFYGDDLEGETRTAFARDGNLELFIIETAGFINSNTVLPQPTRLTATPASVITYPGEASRFPFYADDNRAAAVNNDASLIAFISTRNTFGANAPRRAGDARSNGGTNLEDNSSQNAELFLINRTATINTLHQLTATPRLVPGSNYSNVFVANPSISDDDSVNNINPVISFISNANLNNNLEERGNTTGDNTDHNSEIYVASFDVRDLSVPTLVRQVTRTRITTTTTNEITTSNGIPVNLLNPGKRLSRDGRFIAYQSLAEDPTGAVATNLNAFGLFVHEITTNTTRRVVARAPAGVTDAISFPSFTTDASGQNTKLVFTSSLNLLAANGEVATTASEGLNPNARFQFFSTAITSAGSFAMTFPVTRLTDTPQGTPATPIQAYTSDTERIIAYSLSGTELGGGNSDNSDEVFYQKTLPATPALSPTPTLAFATFASNRPVVAASPIPSPTPTANEVSGLAPGEIAYIRSTSAIGAACQAASTKTRTGKNSLIRSMRLMPKANLFVAQGAMLKVALESESLRRPSLPTEICGVSVAIRGAAAGLYSVSANEIAFVVPVGLPAGVHTVVINNSGSTARASLNVIAAQPDIFTTTNGALGRATITNVTNPNAPTGEPFTAQTVVNGEPRATILAISLTGVRGIPASQISVIFGSGSTAVTLSGTSITSVSATDRPGYDEIRVTLPNTFNLSGDVPVIVRVTSGSNTFSSRPEDTAPRVRFGTTGN